MNDTLTDRDAPPDPLRAFLAALPDRLRHRVHLSVQGVADVHAALASMTVAELAARVSAQDAAGYWNAGQLVHSRLHKAAGFTDDEPRTDEGQDDA